MHFVFNNIPKHDKFVKAVSKSDPIYHKSSRSLNSQGCFVNIKVQKFSFSNFMFHLIKNVIESLFIVSNLVNAF